MIIEPSTILQGFATFPVVVGNNPEYRKDLVATQMGGGEIFFAVSLLFFPVHTLVSQFLVFDGLMSHAPSAPR